MLQESLAALAGPPPPPPTQAAGHELPTGEMSRNVLLCSYRFVDVEVRRRKECHKRILYDMQVGMYELFAARRAGYSCLEEFVRLVWTTEGVL